MQDRILEASASPLTAETTTATDRRRASARTLDLAVVEEAELDIVMQVLDAMATDARTIGEAEAAFVAVAPVAVVPIVASTMSKSRPTVQMPVVQHIATTTHQVVSTVNATSTTEVLSFDNHPNSTCWIKHFGMIV